MGYNKYDEHHLNRLETRMEPLDEYEMEILHELRIKKQEKKRRENKLEELQEIYVPLFKQCVDYYFERKERLERIDLDEQSEGGKG